MSPASDRQPGLQFVLRKTRDGLSPVRTRNSMRFGEKRVTRSDADTLDYRVTVHDAKAYTAPWEGCMVFKLRRGWELLEHTCVAREDPAYLEFKSRAWAPK